MYLRWQYLGPSSMREPGRREWRYFTTACRYHLSVVWNQRDGVTRKPRQHVLLYLGVVDEAWLTLTPEPTRRRYRNRLIDGFACRLHEAEARARLTDGHAAQIRQLVNAAFPKPPAPIVVIPERVRTTALARAAQDAAERAEKSDRDGWRLMNAMRELTGDAPLSFEEFMAALQREAERHKA
jgi:hypothetical protein